MIFNSPSWLKPTGGFFQFWQTTATSDADILYQKIVLNPRILD
ncbi:hypothetical protein COO91_04141 [Nostoc flagelliforme CCNUN1]|uniref:Uncharacterized protein n=1 Tax=Nostoc flagelliforme CCNUN1 TaxID=2038116 RepID=A0A2K8SRV1_9NOSO|nr:hypothetical protein COO91_04141 [Nostoc flagelliforme CCNUN1]